MQPWRVPTEPAPAHTPGPTPTPAPRFSRRTLVVAAAVTAVVLVGGGVAAGLALAGDDDGPAAATSPTAADGDARPTADPTPAGDADSPCEVDYVVRDSWPGGFTVDVTVRNLAEPLDGWTLAWTFAGDERIENLWNAELEQPTADAPGPAVVVRSLGHNAELATGASTSFGFTGAGTSATPPTEFHLAGQACGDPTDDAPATPRPGAAPAPDADTPLYVDPTTQAADAAAAATGEARALLSRIADTPQSFWVTDQDPARAAAAVADYTTRADDAGALGVLVVYAVPGRDCGLYSAGGVEGSAYATWIDAVAGAVVGEPWVVLEPDALPMLGDCEGQGDRVGYLRYAARALTDAGARVYLDVGHSGWLSAEEAAARLNQVGFDHAVGFALNTSNYQTTADSIAYGERVSALTGGATYVVDTSRNGNGSNGEWCNPRGRALGERPRLVDDAALDALFWVKLPGESDGTCNGGPAAGEWFGEIALELARNAG